MAAIRTYHLPLAAYHLYQRPIDPDIQRVDRVVRSHHHLSVLREAQSDNAVSRDQNLRRLPAFCDSNDTVFAAMACGDVKVPFRVEGQTLRPAEASEICSHVPFRVY